MSHVQKIERPGRAGRKGSTRWRARWIGPDGRERAKNFATKGEAVAYLKTTGAAGGSPTMTVAELAAEHGRYFDALVKAGVREQGTADGYATALDVHVSADPAFARTTLADLTTPSGQAFLDRLFERTGSLDLTKRVRRCLVTWCKYGQRKGWLTTNPAQACKVEATSRPDQGEELLELPSKSELARIVAAAGQGDHGARDTAAISLLLFAGLRSSELLGLADANVALTRSGGTVKVRERLERKYVTLGKVKSEKGRRDVPIGPTTATAVKAWRLQRGPAERLFPSAGDSPAWSYAEFIRQAWLPLMRRAGLVIIEPDKRGKNRTRAVFTPHALRHAFASNAIENGVRPKRLQALIGHSTLQMTMDLYGHLWRDEAADEALARDLERTIANAS